MDEKNAVVCVNPQVGFTNPVVQMAQCTHILGSKWFGYGSLEHQSLSVPVVMGLKGYLT